MTAVLDPPGPTVDAVGSGPRTTCPMTVATPVPPHGLRTLSGVTRNDILDAGGAALSALCTGLLLVGRLTPLSGLVGSTVLIYVLFLAVYSFLVSLHEDRPAVVSKVMTALMASGAILAFIALASVIVFTLVRSGGALFDGFAPRWNFFSQDMSVTGPLDPLAQGGISHAVVGTLLIISMAILFTVPLGLVCAVFINETRSPIAGTVRTVVDAMTALPSIVAGLFIFAFWVLLLGFDRSGLAAALAVSVMMLPIVVRSADVVLRLVPGSLREASAALGAPLWRTVWYVVLPTARSGLATAVILGIARGVGETAPVLLTSGFAKAFNADVTENPMMSLPLATFEFVRSPQETFQQRGFATAAVLMVLVLGLFALARVLGGRQAGQLSRSRTRRVAARSANDLARIEGRRGPTGHEAVPAT